MREIKLDLVTQEVEKLCIESNYFICQDVFEKLEEAYEKEESKVAKNILGQILENDRIAAREQVPICQDTGLAVIFLEIGTEVRLNGDIYEAINEGVRRGYEKGYLRKSSVRHPLDRVNTKDNTPAIIHTKLVAGSDKIKIVMAPKGGGAENMSTVKMLKPADGIEGVKKFVVDFVKNASGNPCPPIFVGIGLGGTFEKSALLAKQALLRDVNDESEDPINAKLEKDLLELINKTGVGPMGLGGMTTAIAVKVESFPCHIASLPLAININCHASRHKSIVL
ncbi:MAG: fumarate hydratase [Fusobacterium sp.]